MLLASFSLLFSGLPGQISARTGHSIAVGTLLVAEPSMPDPRFRETVILLLRHDRTGAVGLILNRPSSIGLNKVFPHASVFERHGGILFHGGPVAQDRLSVLWQGKTIPPGLEALPDEMAVSGPKELIHYLARSEGLDPQYRVFAGYCGWKPGQLRRELESGDWSLRPSGRIHIFAVAPSMLWQRLQATSGAVLI